MPEMDGYQVLERIKGDINMRDIPVIVISALDEIESVVRCIEMGAEDYLPKSFNPVLLQARLNASMQKKKLRDLEKAFLEQEIALRQNEKLATIGKLSAGMAHELNNPASAANRGAANLSSIYEKLKSAYLDLIRFNLTEEQKKLLAELDESARLKAEHPEDLDTITRSDLEADLEDWLETQGIPEAWELTPRLITLGCSIPDLQRVAAAYTQEQFNTVIQWMSCTCEVYRLMGEINQSTIRVSDIVNEMKAYTYLDQAPVQMVDVHTALDSTISVLQNKLDGIFLTREYENGLPRIEAYGSELNQVWTHLLENAIEAIREDGKIRITTAVQNAMVRVSIEDNGCGIPEQIKANIYDPFFTTKPIGDGTGLGLNVVHNTVVQKHNGRIELESEPGQTRFDVWLPLAHSP
jgi:signal transduction histidine kinase